MNDRKLKTSEELSETDFCKAFEHLIEYSGWSAERWHELVNRNIKNQQFRSWFMTLIASMTMIDDSRVFQLYKKQHGAVAAKQKRDGIMTQLDEIVAEVCLN